MNNQYRSRGSASSSGRSSQPHASEPAVQGIRAKAEEATSKLSDVAQQAGSQAKQTASSMAAEATQGAKRFLDDQIVAGADLAGHVADSVRSAADKLEQNAPQLAGLVRGGADGVERFSREIREQSARDLWRTASDFTRNQPAVVFGLASLAGFLLYRVLKADSSEGERRDRQYHPRQQSRREHSDARTRSYREDPGQAYGS
jgi:ElaB/YqjD/DUF883 family membrane-anchored ribosome-binding protein